MPRDVRTRWNLTYDMLKFALEYKVAIVKITGELEMNLRKFELTEEEWALAAQLADALKVRSGLFCLRSLIDLLSRITRSLRMQLYSSPVTVRQISPW